MLLNFNKAEIGKYYIFMLVLNIDSVNKWIYYN